jgi:hypothetical protein
MKVDHRVKLERPRHLSVLLNVDVRGTDAEMQWLVEHADRVWSAFGVVLRELMARYGRGNIGFV